MSDIEVKEGGKGGKVRNKKASMHIDFAPLVDLAFLLITFFMLVTTLSKPQTMEISMPAKDNVDIKDAPKVNVKKVITILIGKNNNLFYFFGAKVKPTDPDPIVEKSDYSPTGLRTVLLKRNIDIMLKIKALKEEKVAKNLADTTYKRLASKIRAEKSAPVVIIKATDESTYNNLVDVLDEMQICNIGKYSIVEITDYDLNLIKDLNK